MPRTRVLVVDDAVVVRKIVTEALSADPRIEVVGTAPNGRIALSKIAHVNPDIVTLDVEMPEMDGISALRELRRTHPKLPVIMFSTLTERGASVTVEALLLGANDYVAKPANVGSVSEAVARIREQLLPKIHALCPAGTVSPNGSSRMTAATSVASVTPRTAPARPRAASTPVEAVVIGVSTGGPNALAELVPALPGDLPVPVLVVQHMPPMFTRLLAERLDTTTALHVSEAATGDVVVAGRILIAPGDRHLEVRRHGVSVEVVLTDAPPENSCRPAADVLFRSAARVWGAGTLGVVMTGMGADARRGSEEVRAAGGQVIVQDRASSVVWGMPGAVIQAGFADEIVPLAQLADRVTERVRAARRPVGAVPREVAT